MIDIVGMFPGDGRCLRRRTVAGGCQRTGAQPAAPDDRCSTSRDDSVISRGDPRAPSVSEPPIALQPLGDLWFGTGFLRFRFGAPILPGFAFILGSSCRQTCLCRQLIEVLGALAAQRALCRGRSETNLRALSHCRNLRGSIGQFRHNPSQVTSAAPFSDIERQPCNSLSRALDTSRNRTWKFTVTVPSIAPRRRRQFAPPYRST